MYHLDVKFSYTWFWFVRLLFKYLNFAIFFRDLLATVGCDLLATVGCDLLATVCCDLLVAVCCDLLAAVCCDLLATVCCDLLAAVCCDFVLFSVVDKQTYLIFSTFSSTSVALLEAYKRQANLPF